MAETLTAEHFIPHVDKVFRVRETAHALTLDRVERLDAQAAVGLRQPFNLIVHGPPGNVLPEGMREMALDDGTAFALYVIPIHTPVRDRQNYQVAFN